MPCRILRFALIAAIAVLCSSTARSQQANIGVPFGQLNNGFFEQSAVGFSFNGPNFFFRQNSFDLAIPQFGGYTPDAGATFGFGVPLGNGQASFNFAFGQGAQSSMNSTAVSTTIGNGGFGGFSAGGWTPFVVGAVPVVGGAPVAGGGPIGPAGSSSLLAERLSRLPHEGQSAKPSAGGPEPAPKVDPSLDPFQRQLAVANATGGTSAVSVARIEEMRNSQRAAQQQSAAAEIDRLIAKADSARQTGKSNVARIYLQQAAAKASGDRKSRLLKQIEALPQ